MVKEIFMDKTFERSETGRRIRKDSFEACHDMDEIERILRHLYTDKRMSTTEIPKVMRDEYKIQISGMKCYLLIRRLGIMRSMSESVSIATSELNYDVVIMNDELRDIVDGIVIGDGNISPNHNTKVARLSISGSHKDFISYCRRLLMPYSPSELSFRDGEKGIGTWNTTTKHHPDIYKMYVRWYPNDKKDVPEDIVLSPTVILLWYLGDGSLSSVNDNNSRSLYFATNSFRRESIENILVKKLKEIGIVTSRITSDNRLFIDTKSMPRILEYMGGESPVQSYSYKFDIEDWRKMKSMKEVSIELNIDYQKLANWVKTGFVKHSRSPGGKKVLFSDDEYTMLKNRIDSGELPKEKGKKAHVRIIQSGENFNFTKLPSESDDDFIERIVVFYQKSGFPYPRWNEERLLKAWFGLRKSQYIIPETDNIKWRNDGMSFADYFHPHIFSINSKGKMSPKGTFDNKDKFVLALKKYKEINTDLTHSGVLSAISRNASSKRVNNFSPLVARDIYNYYCRDGFKILDFSAGFSGRLIGASVSCRKNIEYLGIEPSNKTFSGLVNTKQFIDKLNIGFKSNISNDTAENFLPTIRDNSFDFCFTSPPYFNLEEYSNESSQSYVKFSSYDTWKEKFLSVVIQETYRILKDESYFVLNIGRCEDFNIPEDAIRIGKDVGFNVEQIKYILFKNYSFVEGDEYRKEPLVIFRKVI